MKKITIKGLGRWLMIAVLSLFSVYAANAQCTYQIELTDPGYGDGWNGGRVTVFVNGTAVLTDITLASGSGPEYHDFTASTGDEITTDYTGGGWPYENNYKILDPGGNVQFETGYPNGTPSDLVSPGVTANCPVTGDILVTVTDVSGNPLPGIEVGVIDFNTLHTDAAGQALFSGVELGIWTVYAFQPGVNYIEQEAEVFLGQTTNVDFVMAPPIMVINPLAIVETLNPGEYLTTYIGIQNIGAGDLYWTAEIVYPPLQINENYPKYGISKADIEYGTVANTMALDRSEAGDIVNGIEGARTVGDVVQTFTPVGNDPWGTAWDGQYIYLTNPWSNGNIIHQYNLDGSATGYSINASFGGSWIGDMACDGTKLYCCNVGGDNAIKVVDIATGNLLETVTGAWTVTSQRGLAYDESNMEYYIGGWNSNNIWRTAADGSTIDEFGYAGVSGLAYHPNGGPDAEGSLWVVANTSADLVEELDPNAAWASLQSFGIPFGASYSGAGMDLNSDGNLWVVNQSTKKIYLCDTEEPLAAGGWLTLDFYDGSVPANGGSMTVPTNLNATGTQAGEVYNADIVFSANPNVSETTVPVTMIIAGDELVPATDLEAILTNQVTGQVNLSWSFPSGVTFEYFLIRRNGQAIANTQNLTYVDMLPTYGVYDYTVSAVYVEGETLPAGPEQVIWFIPEMCWNPTAPENWQWIESEEQVELWISNCGEGTLTFTFPDYEDGDVPDGSFIVAVNPVNGQISEGDSVRVMMTYSSVGYGVGDYINNLTVNTNELAPDDVHIIVNTMHVYTPGHLFGTVTDCNSGMPLNNVTVTAVGAETYFTETAENGTYDMLVDEDTYDVSFTRIGLQTTIVADTFATQGVMTEVSVSICEVPYPVGWVFLDPNEADTEALITWSDPMGPYEIIYDDGSAEDYAMWVQAGGKSAVRFTPAGYPARVQGGRIFVGDGSLPVGADFLGTNIAIGILDDDGMNGMPGTILDSAVFTVNNYGWVSFGGFNRTIEDGDFYLVYWQLGTPPNAAPVGIDTDVPTVYRSYIAQAGTDWIVSPYQDFMFRATVSGPNQNIMMSVAPGTRIIPPKIPANAKVYIATSRPSGIAGTVKGGTFMPIINNDNSGDRNFDKYRVRWHDNFDPDAGEGPEDGEWHHRAWRTTNSLNDVQWGPRDPGFYAYSVQAKYESGDTSEWIYSNVAAHGLDNVATFTIEQCDDSVPDNIEVLLVGKNYPYQRLEGIATVIPADNQAVMVFDSVINGAYDLTIFKVGYQRYFHFDIQIFNDYEEFIVLQENAFPPRNLYVDALTSVATWDPALIEQLRMETFEGETFPPAGWQATTLAAEGWFRSDDGGSDGFPIPAGDGFYAVDNDDKQGSISDGSMDYLITPMMDMRQSETYALYYDSYYTAANGEEAYIEFSTDAGATWEVFNTLTTPVTDWTPTMVDLAPLSGPDGYAKIWFAFHASDGGNDNWASGWAIDNVVVHNGPAPNLGYYVYLDDSFVAQTAVGYETYTYRDLVYGVTYKASVRALYACGLSAPIDYWWTSTYLYPPRKLGDAYLYGTNEVPIYWFPPVTGSGVPMAANVDYPKYDIQESNIEYGKVANTLAFNRSSAGDIVHSGSGMRDYGDVVAEVTPAGVQPWGVAFDGEFLYVTDPFGSAGTVINQFNVDGSATGYTIDGSAGGPSWVGDMASDGTNIYACNVGGDNAINVYDIETGALINTITGAWTVTSQRGLAYDQYNAEYYIGGWNSNNIWRTDDAGATIDEFGFAGVSGLAWHPAGGPNADGSLWVVANSADDLVTETDPNAGWPLLQDFGIPSAAGFSGAGLGLNSDGMLWVVNQSNGIIYLVDVDEPLSFVPIPEVPDGLIGFKVYQDAEWIADVPYNGEDYTDSIWYVINPLDPDCYVFDVSAIYDLGVYGFPGEEGESALEGPDTVCVVWGYGLPFLEDWNEGDFAFNGWRLEDENWKMNSQVGDPEPSAEFTWDPLLENDYSSTLTTNPLLGDLLTEGDIFVDFNVKLADRNMTGEEKLLVEITNDAGDSWHQVAELTNANGSFDFADGFNHINITPQAMGHVFQVRFNAVGQNSFDIVSWYVDNINVYRTCGAPTDLSGIYKWVGPIGNEEWGAEVCWNAPELPIPPALWIFWDDGTYAGGVGLTDGGTWSLAQRWDAGQLTNWQGEDLSNAKITKMSFVLNDDGFSSITLKIWSGSEASTLLYEQVVASPVPGDWQEVTLDTPVDFDENDELWIGYTIADQPAGKFPGGNDAGPAIPGYGDMINTGGATWDKVSDFGIDKNWVVHAFAEELPTTASLPTLIDNTVYSGNGELSESTPVDEVKVAPNTIERAFTGFSLYRQEVGVDDDYVLYQPIPYVEGQTEYCYFDKAPAVTAGHTYNYQVTSNWVGDTDACESDPALNIPMTEDFVTVLVTDIGDNQASETNLYPNPATDRVNVSSTQSMERITVLNYVGQVVFDQQLNGEKAVTLNTASYEAGVYVVRIDTEDGTITKRVVITK